MSRDITLQGSKLDGAALFVGPLLVLVIMYILAGWTGSEVHAGVQAINVLASTLPWAALWLAAAVGFGWPLRRWLVGEGENAAPVQLGFGIAAMLTIDAALGRLGLLQFAGTTGAWGVVVIGIALLAIGWWKNRTATQTADNAPSIVLTAPPWLIWTAAPSVAVLLLASASAPGWLWASEFGGYDAMSYHLQLPKEWITLGAIQPLEHNVYSFLPSYMEGAYYHLLLLRGDAISGVYACQLMHAAMVIATAWIVIRVVAAWSREAASGAVAGVVLAGTPWVIVVGSLAYNELATMLMLATGLLVFQLKAGSPSRRGAAMGVLAAAACGAKLTAVGFVTAPLGIALLMSTAVRHWPRAIAAASLAGVLVLGPYLLGNAAASGNPVFPFATSLFGSAHWNQQQVEIWNSAHMSVLSVSERLVEAWHQLMRYGLGSNPYDGEPWLAQWSLLPWLAIVAVAVIWLLRRRNNAHTKFSRLLPLLVLVMVVQLLFWLGFTHIKSRFMLPAVVPAAIVVAMAWFTVSGRINMQRRSLNILCGIGLVLWCLLPTAVFLKQAGGAPAARIGMAELLTGAGLSHAERLQFGAVHPAIHLNHLLPEGSKVLLIGEAAPLYYRGTYTYQTTWDRGPLSQAMNEHVDDPSQWLRNLHQRSYTHLLVNPAMLDRWEQSGWNDPLLTAERVHGFAEEHGVLQHTWPSGERLYRLR